MKYLLRQLCLWGIAGLFLLPLDGAAQTFTDFEPAGFSPGTSLDDLQPDGTTISPPMAFINSCREAWFVPTAGTDEEIVDLNSVPPQPGLDAAGHGKVWRLSNGADSGPQGQSPHSPRNPNDISGEVANLPDDACGPSTTTNYYAELDFRSVTGLHQSGPAPMRLTVSANSSDTRQAFLYITDNGSGLDLTYFETADGCGFPATTIATGLSYTDWHTLGIEIFFNPGLAAGTVGATGAVGNDVVNIYVNNVLVHTGTTWESCVGARVVDQLLFETRNESTDFLGGGLYFDNVLVTDVCPEGNCVANEPPVCMAATPSVSSLWPPNHKFVSVDVLGVTDPDSDPVSITIDSIWQDEPVGSEADGMGIGTSTAEVRAERAGSGNGRFYHINFTADDGNGGTCSGEVLVGVPHNQGKKGAPVDDGALYDSTVPSGASKAETEQAIAAVPEQYELSSAYPNPFNPVTTINYTLPEAAHVRIAVYDVLGQKVDQLVDRFQEAGTHDVQFDATNLSSGTYFYEMEAGSFKQVKTMILMK